MRGRSRDEEHRASTPLELFFDLCFVVGVSQAASELAYAFGHDHSPGAVLSYAMVFFAIWWAWMNFTWFASAYDTDDVPYRLLTLVQIVGRADPGGRHPEAVRRARSAGWSPSATS